MRQALNYGIDKETIVNSLYFGQYQPAYRPLNAAALGFDPTLKDLYPYDQAKANDLLEQAGWTKGSDGIRQKNDQPLKVSYYAGTGD